MGGLSLDTKKFAVGIATTLALMNWVAKIDADDVEFVLRGGPSARVNAQGPALEKLSRILINTNNVE